MRKQNIVAVITHNSQGGAQEALARLCKRLAQRDHNVTLWYLYKNGTRAPTDVSSQFVLETENPSFLDYLKIPFLLAKKLARHRPNVIISFLPLANVLTQSIGWVLRIPVRIASQRNPVQTYNRPMQLVDWYVGTIGCYTHNVLNSSDVRQSVNGYPWPYRFRTRIIHNGIEPTSFDKGRRAEARSHFQINASEVALVSIGRLTKQKNQAFLIQILGALDGFRLLLAGAGPELDRLRVEALRMGVADRVSFLGAIQQSDTKRLLFAADIFALPSLYEGQSNALLEAMSAGKPIVTNDIPSHRETLIDQHLEAGIVLPTTSPEQWISTLRELAQNRQKREQFGKLAQRRVQIFSLDRMCTAFERTIESSKSGGTKKHRDDVAQLS